MNLKDIVRLWHKTQMGNIHECKKNQLIFADIMWRLYEEMQPEIFDEWWIKLKIMVQEVIRDR